MPTRIGKYTLQLDKAPGILGFASVAGKKEKEGPLGAFFDVSHTDNTLGDVSWEKAESQLQTEAVQTALKKAALEGKDVDYILAGDLLNQCISSTFGLRSLGIPFLGQYGACSTMAQTLGLASLFVESGIARRAVAVTSSHFCSAERQFRFPLEYGGQRTPTAQWTATAAGSVVVGAHGRGEVKINAVTFGRIADLGIKDANNMGAAMAPAAYATIKAHFDDMKTAPEDFDLIVTGDLGQLGKEMLLELARRDGVSLGGKLTDCGTMVFDNDKQDVHAGGSGCGCSAITLCGYLLGQLNGGKLKKILFCGTGALLSPTSTQQGLPIPGVCHAVCIAGGT
jgi:stage V sporulation protein AD